MSNLNEQEEFVYDPSVEEEIFTTEFSPEEITPKAQELYAQYENSFAYTNLNNEVAYISVVKLGKSFSERTGINLTDLNDYKYLVLNLDNTDLADFVEDDNKLEDYLSENTDGKFKVFDLSYMAELYNSHLKEILGRRAEDYVFDLYRYHHFFA